MLRLENVLAIPGEIIVASRVGVFGNPTTDFVCPIVSSGTCFQESV